MHRDVADLIQESYASLDDIFAPRPREEPGGPATHDDGNMDWDRAVLMMSEALREGDLRPAFVQALIRIRKRQEVLAQNAPHRTKEDENEEEGEEVGAGEKFGASNLRDERSTCPEERVAFNKAGNSVGSVRASSSRRWRSLRRQSKEMGGLWGSADKSRVSVLDTKNEEAIESPKERERRVLQRRKKALENFSSGANLGIVNLIAVLDALTRSMRGISTVEPGQQLLSIRQRRAVALRLVDFRQLLFQLSRAVTCSVRERVALFFKLYGHNNEISIDGLCALLYLGDRVVASSLQDAERFIRSLDQDGDDSITLEEFQHAIEKNPFTLESIVRTHAEAQDVSIEQQHSLRAFVHRTSLSWAGMCTLWERLHAKLAIISKAGEEGNEEADVEDADALADVQEKEKEAVQTRLLMTKERFEAHLCAHLRPPEPEDPQLVSEVSAAFVGRVRPNAVDVRAFVSALGGTLGELNVGISDCLHKAKLYFALHNLDNDGVLTRDEIYQMLFTSNSALGRKILKAAALLRTMDQDGNGTISQDEFWNASKRNATFLSSFQAL
ncbi:Calcium-binding protein NCS-1 [Hondaea fermentalgiana]|uniref:Calcium-binding protein NCS-1 n=1 Tax=Hondaea fermentalgiana TaxID=2315210 RepID=A0A2R5GB34_9STRA|nr:Calcium-binding protein NCS-1 [Hondaea fermentalgiana]|eukprot:GBG27549.1 Calcium-binding protein NCS-1 [Hondaea fermentalgiana]